MSIFGSPRRRGLIRQRTLTKRSGALSRRITEQWELETATDRKPTTAERRMWHNPLCVGCGHFTSWQSDNYTNWGGYNDTDPPDPSYLCDRCLAVDIAEAMTRAALPDHWIPAAWEFQAAKLLGLTRTDDGRWVTA